MKTLKKISLAVMLLGLMFILMIGLGTTASAETYGLMEYEIESGEVTITGCDESFSGDLVIPETIDGYPVTTIGEHAFAYCGNLTGITIPDSVTMIERGAMYYCESLEIAAIGNCVEIIGDYAFDGCDKLTSITLPDSLITIGEKAFSGCRKLANITIPNSVTTIGDWAFQGCRSFTSITVPAGVETIGVFAFGNCDLTEIIVDENNKNYSNDEYGVLYNKDKSTLIQYPGGNIEEYIIPDGVTTISECAFSCCVRLKRVIIPDSVTTIGDSAFSTCEELTSIIIPDSVTTIDRYTFNYCMSLTNITIPDSITTICEGAFFYCRNFTNITIPDSVIKIDDVAFLYCENLERIAILNPDCEIFDSENTIDSNATIYGYANSTAQAYAEKYDRTFVDIENNEPENPILQYLTYTIANGEVTITDCDTSISGDVVIPETIEGYPVTAIGYDAFASCSGLTSVTILSGVTTIGDYAFYYCSNLESVTIGKNVTVIGESAFIGCSNIENIIIPESVTTIGDFAFSYCSSLPDIIIPDSVISVGNYAFQGCKGLTNVTVGNSVTNIGNGAFYLCNSLESITIKNPDCELYDSESTINSGATIYGCLGSTAQTYAEKYDREFVAIGHEHSYTSKITAPTCTAKGYTTYTCDCGDSYKSDYVNAKGHKGGTATCKAKAKCTVCGTSYGSLASHSYAGATCTKPKTCKVCKATTGSANGHNYAAATCTKAKTCKVCGATSGKANGHKYTNACDTSCNTCKATRKITHTYKNVVTKATLSKSGKIVNKCSVCGSVKSTKTIAYAKTFKLSATSYTYDGKVKAPTVTVKDSAGKTLKNGTDYTVTYASGRKSVGAYKVTITMKGNYSGTKTLYMYILPSKTSKITPTATTTTLKAQWNKVTGATGYKVELLNENGKVVKTVTTTKLTYTFSKLSVGTTYKIRVTAYKTISGAKKYSLVSTTLSTATKPATPTLKVTSTKKGIANFTWTNVVGETGYQVYYSTKKDSGFKSVASYKTDVLKGSKSSLTSGKTYYFKVRAYKKVGSTVIYGDWSTVKSVKIK